MRKHWEVKINDCAFDRVAAFLAVKFQPPVKHYRRSSSSFATFRPLARGPRTVLTPPAHRSGPRPTAIIHSTGKNQITPSEFLDLVFTRKTLDDEDISAIMSRSVFGHSPCMRRS